MPPTSRQERRRPYLKSGIYALRNAVLTLGSRALPPKSTALGRALHDWREALLADLGGVEAVSTQQAAVVAVAVPAGCVGRAVRHACRGSATARRAAGNAPTSCGTSLPPGRLGWRARQRHRRDDGWEPSLPLPRPVRGRAPHASGVGLARAQIAPGHPPTGTLRRARAPRAPAPAASGLPRCRRRRAQVARVGVRGAVVVPVDMRASRALPGPHPLPAAQLGGDGGRGGGREGGVSMTIIATMTDLALFGAAFPQTESLAAWRAFLAACFGLPMTDEQAAT